MLDHSWSSLISYHSDNKRRAYELSSITMSINDDEDMSIRILSLGMDPGAFF